MNHDQNVIMTSLENKSTLNNKQQSITNINDPTQSTKENNPQQLLIHKLAEKALKTAEELKCEGRFHLKPADLVKIDPKLILNQAITQLEEAWKLAYAKDHPAVEDIKIKEKKLIELQNWYFQQACLREECKPATLFFRKFEEIAEKNPNNNALIFESGNWTYQHLNEKANQIAHCLIKLKEKNKWPDETRIALFFENSPEAVAAIIAVMKSSLAYVPLTVHNRLPIERLTYYLKNSDAKMIITQDKFVSTNHEFINYLKNKKELNGILINSFQQILDNNKKNDNPNIEVNPDQLAYILYSSGSTGKPKGIKSAHRGLLAPVEAVRKIFDLGQNDRIGWHSLLTFDASLLDIMTPLTFGLPSVIIPQEIRTDSEKLEKYMNDKEISIITLVPSVIDILHPENLPKLRGYLSVGERARKSHFESFHTTGRLPQDPPRIGVNGFGHTEASMCTSLGLYVPNTDLHIGYSPVPGLEWFVLSLPTDECPFPKSPQFVPEGQPGELYLAGNNLALGYVDITADYQQRFRAIPHPDPNRAGEMLWIYQTGDKVQWTKDKKLIFLDRVDNQCKFLGELIHPAEIENSIINSHQNITFKEAQVIIKGYELQSNSSQIGTVEKPANTLPILHAYIEPHTAITDYEKLIRELHLELKNFHYIVPSRFSFLSSDQWPKNQSGKIDRKELAKNICKTFYIDPIFKIEPQDHIEMAIANIWYDILQISRNELIITLEHNFYDLGGRSIHTSEMLSKINLKFNHYTIDIAKFNACPSIRALAYQVRNSDPNLKHINHMVKWYNGEMSFKLNQNNNRFPIILINAVTGDATKDYQNIMAEWLNFMSDWPLLYTQALSLYNPGYIVSSLSQLAKDYIESINTENTLKNYAGPLILIGYSAGGTLAYEIARQLKKQNRPAAVLLIDSESPNYYNALSQEAYAKEIHDLMFHMSKVMKIDPDAMRKTITVTELQKYPGRKQLAVFWQNFMEQHCNDSKEDQEKYLGCYATYHNFSQTLFDYKPEPLDGITLLSFSETRDKCKDERLGWDKNYPLNEKKLNGKHLAVVSDLDWVRNIIMPEVETFCEQSQKQLTLYQHQLSHLVKEMHQLYLSENGIKIDHPFDKKYNMSFDEDYINLSIYKNVNYDNNLNEYGEKKARWEDIILNNSNNLFEKQDGKDVNLNEILSFHKSEQKIVILGQKGAGKTTFLKYLRFLSAQNSSNKKRPVWYKKYILTLYVPLCSLLEYTPSQKYTLNDPREICRFVCSIIRNEFQTQTYKNIDEKKLYEIITLNSQHILWLIDCDDRALSLLDETHKLSILVKSILKQPNIILTASPLTFKQNIINTEYYYELTGYDDAMIEKYAITYLRHKHQDQSESEILNDLKHDTSIWALAHNPFYLSLLCMLLLNKSLRSSLYDNRLPLTYTEIIGQLLECLQKKYLIDYKINLNLVIDKQSELNKIFDKTMSLLERLSFETMEQNTAIFSFGLIKNYIDLHNMSTSEQTDLIEKINAINLLVWDNNKDIQIDNNVRIINGCLQEYLAARHCFKIFNSEKFNKILNRYKLNPSFRGVWWFLAGLLANNSNDIQRFFNLLFDKPREMTGIYDAGNYETMLMIGCLEQTKFQSNIMQSEYILNNMIERIIISLGDDFRLSTQLKDIFIDLLRHCPIIQKKIFANLNMQSIIITILNTSNHLSGHRICFYRKIARFAPIFTMLLAQKIEQNQTRLNNNILEIINQKDILNKNIVDFLLEKLIDPNLQNKAHKEYICFLLSYSYNTTIEEINHTLTFLSKEKYGSEEFKLQFYNMLNLSRPPQIQNYEEYLLKIKDTIKYDDINQIKFFIMFTMQYYNFLQNLSKNISSHLIELIINIHTQSTINTSDSLKMIKIFTKILSTSTDYVKVGLKLLGDDNHHPTIRCLAAFMLASYKKLDISFILKILSENSPATNAQHLDFEGLDHSVLKTLCITLISMVKFDQKQINQLLDFNFSLLTPMQLSILIEILGDIGKNIADYSDKLKEVVKLLISLINYDTPHINITNSAIISLVKIYKHTDSNIKNEIIHHFAIQLSKTLIILSTLASTHSEQLILQYESFIKTLITAAKDIPFNDVINLILKNIDDHFSYNFVYQFFYRLSLNLTNSRLANLAHPPIQGNFIIVYYDQNILHYYIDSKYYNASDKYGYLQNLFTTKPVRSINFTTNDYYHETLPKLHKLIEKQQAAVNTMRRNVNVLQNSANILLNDNIFDDTTSNNKSDILSKSTTISVSNSADHVVDVSINKTPVPISLQQKNSVSNPNIGNINYSTLQELANILLSKQKFSELTQTVDNARVTDSGIEQVLNHYLKDIAHIVQPSLSSITSPFGPDSNKANTSLINYAKEIFGYFDNDNEHHKNGFLAEDGGNLLKPVVMVINTASAKPKSATDTSAVGGNHWVTCVILPKHYKILDKEYTFDTEQIYFIDSLYENKKLPDSFKNIFLNELTYLDQRDPSKEEINKNPELAQKTISYSHKIKPTFISPKFIDLVDIPQQVGGSDCGYWAVYNALMIVLTGSGDYTKNFTNPRTRDFGLKLRTLFPNLACDFTLKNTISIKEFTGQMFHKPAPKQVLTDEQIAINIAITRSEENMKKDKNTNLPSNQT